MKAALQQVEPEARPIPETSPQYDEIGKGDFPLFSFPPREGSTLSVRSNKPNAVLWVSQPVTAIDVGLTLPIYALPTIELASATSRWEITVRPEWGWAVMQALTIEDGRVLVSNAIVVRTGP